MANWLKKFQGNQTSSDYAIAKTARLLPRDEWEHPVEQTQDAVPGFSTLSLGAASIAVFGAGGGSEIVRGLVRKGVGSLRVFDPDHVELRNLTRQYFRHRDLDMNKAVALVQNVATEATGATEIEGFATTLQQAFAGGLVDGASAAVVMVDNNIARLVACRELVRRRIPAVFVGLSETGEQGYIFVQEADRACWRCAFPDEAVDRSAPCAASSFDIVAVTAGTALCALDSCLGMRRVRRWNLRYVDLTGSTSDWRTVEERRSGCEVCSVAWEGVGRNGV